MNRLVWDLRYPPAYLAPGVNEGFRERIAVVTGNTDGPLAMPGTYSVTLTTADGWSQTKDFEVRLDPRVNTPGYRPQFTIGKMGKRPPSLMIFTSPICKPSIRCA